MVRSTDLENLDFSCEVKYVDKHAYNYLKKSKLYGGELLINKIGNPGRCYLMPKLEQPVTLGMNLFLVRINPNKQYTYQFIWAFLNSEIGQKIIYRKINGTAPFSIDKEAILSLYIPRLLVCFQKKIANIVDMAYSKIFDSKSLYTEAEQLLLQELGLVNFKPSTENIAIKKLSESFGTTGRLDAEYYQPKYEEIENVISKYRLGYNAIGSVFKLSKQNFKVDKDKLYEYVEIGSINVSSGEIVPELITGAELPSNAKRKLKVGQVIVSKVRTYRSGIAIIDKDNYVGSTAFSILEEKPNGKVNKETLFSFLRSNLFLEWSLKPNTGTSYPVILDEDILNFNIPLIDTNIQNIIASKIQQSFALRKESKHLLDIAKQAVEMAIEEDEETAIKWLNEVTIPETNIHEKS